MCWNVCANPHLISDDKQKMHYPSLTNRVLAARTLTAGIAALLTVGFAAAAEAPAVPSVTALQCGHLIDTAAGKVLGQTRS
jgi:hypothetical protein